MEKVLITGAKGFIGRYVVSLMEKIMKYVLWREIFLIRILTVI